MSNQLKGVLFASISALFWGFLAIAIKVTTQTVPSLNIVWFRFFFAFVVMFLYFLITDAKKLKILIKPPALLLLTAIGLAVNYLGFTKGVEYVSPNTAQVVIQAGPILLGVVGFAFFKEALGRWQIVGLTVAAVGMLLFYHNELGSILHPVSKDRFQTGFMWVLLGALGWLAYAVTQKILVRKYDGQLLNLAIFGFPALMYTPTLNADLMWQMTTKEWLLMIFLGANTIIAYGALAKAFKYADANKISVVITLNPIITFTVMAVLHWQQVQWIETQALSWSAALGGLMVLAGAVLVVAFKPAKG